MLLMRVVDLPWIFVGCKMKGKTYDERESRDSFVRSCF